MLFVDGALALIMFAVWVFCIIDVITTPEGASRNLPKLAWLLIVILLADAGSIAWLLAGRPWGTRKPASAVPMAWSRRGSAARPTSPDDDEEFLASLRARAEEQRRREREAKEHEDPPGPAPLT